MAKTGVKPRTIVHEIVMTLLLAPSNVVTRTTGPGSRSVNVLLSFILRKYAPPARDFGTPLLNLSQQFVRFDPCCVFKDCGRDHEFVGAGLVDEFVQLSPHSGRRADK